MNREPVRPHPESVMMCRATCWRPTSAMLSSVVRSAGVMYDTRGASSASVLCMYFVNHVKFVLIWSYKTSTIVTKVSRQSKRSKCSAIFLNRSMISAAVMADGCTTISTADSSPRTQILKDSIFWGNDHRSCLSKEVWASEKWSESFLTLFGVFMSFCTPVQSTLGSNNP